MLKQSAKIPTAGGGGAQPPSGGCVLKQSVAGRGVETDDQPPSGGCVLKPAGSEIRNSDTQPAAFRRLCVETIYGAELYSAFSQPPSGGCVLKHRFSR